MKRILYSTKEAAIIAVNRIFTQLGVTSLEGDTHVEIPEEQLAQLAVEQSDFEAALKKVQPSSKREGFVTVPNTTWDDIGALASVREKLRVSVVEPIRNPTDFYRSST